MNEEWRTVYEEYIGDITRFLTYLTRQPKDAEDLAQETFIRAFRSWKQFAGRSSLKTWLFSIARNIAIDHLRKEQRVTMLKRLLKGQPSEPSVLPEEIVRLSDRKQTLYKAISTLSVPQRMVVILRGIQELAPLEVADILGWNTGRVNVTYHRALQRLRHLIEEEDMMHELVTR